MNNFTEEQEKKLKELKKKYSNKMLFLMVRCFILLVISNTLVLLAVVYYVHSLFFVFVASFLSGFSFSKLFIENLNFLDDTLKEETIKVIQNRN